MNPPGATLVNVNANQVCDWGMSIKLTREALAHLEKVAGPTLDERFLLDGDQMDLKTETWAWFINWDVAREPGQQVIGFWFKDVRHAVYFKTLWGGS